MFLCTVDERGVGGGGNAGTAGREWYRDGDDISEGDARSPRTPQFDPHRERADSLDSCYRKGRPFNKQRRHTFDLTGTAPAAGSGMTILKGALARQSSWDPQAKDILPNGGGPSALGSSGSELGASPRSTGSMEEHALYLSHGGGGGHSTRSCLPPSPPTNYNHLYASTNHQADYTNNNYVNTYQDYTPNRKNMQFDEQNIHMPTRVNGFCGLYGSSGLSRSLDGCLDDWSQGPTYGDHRRHDGLVDYTNGAVRSRRTGSTSSDQSLDGEGSTASGGGSTGSGQSHPGGYYTLPSTPSNVNGTLDFPRGCDAESMGRILDFHRSLAKYYTLGQRSSEPSMNCPNERRKSIETNASSDSNEAVPPPSLRGRAQSEDLGLSLSTLQIKSILRQNSNQNGCSKGNHSAPTTPVHGLNNSQSRTPKSIKFNLSTISEFQTYRRTATSADDLQVPLRQRSMSACDGALGINRCSSLSDDDDPGDDDYGFLSYPGLISTFPPTAMQKTKTPVSIAMTTGHRILPKKWRKTKLLSGSYSTSSPKHVSVWKHEAACTWSSANGSKLVLSSTNLTNLTDIERLALQKIALARLQAMDLGCTIAIPKDGSKRSKRSAFSLKRKTESASSGWVFGIPLSKCIANDIELRRRRPSLLQERRDSVSTRKSSSSSVASSLMQPIHVAGQRSHSVVYEMPTMDPSRMDAALRSLNQQHAGGMTSDSFSESDNRSIGSNLLDALSLSSSAKPRRNVRTEQRDPLTPHSPQVPYIVNSCCKHLETYGLHILGIFRIGSSKKRVKQLREEYDSGKDVKLNEEHSPHDIGALLKEFFRDLPDPLLTRDLYSAFVATRKIQTSDRRRAALHHLVSLLPVPNRDTLWSLLKFLSQVAQHSTDQIDEHGLTILGNKMDAHNLATLFGPNILHKAKGGEYEVETMERAEERKEVIAVIQELIEQSHNIFELCGDLHDEVLQAIHETNPEGFDLLLKRKTAAMGMDSEAETSSSYFEQESDASSSIPHTPSYGGPESDSHPHSLSEALAMQARHAAHSDSGSRKLRSEDPPADTLKVPQFRIISPEHGAWYRADSRSPSPVSPRISPCPKAMKPGVPDLRIRITPDSSGDDRTSSPSMSAQALISPRPTRYRRQLIPTMTTPTSIPSPHPASQRDTNTLNVPAPVRKTMHESDSCSSLSSYYPMSSRSGTASPMTPDPPNSPRGWYPETPPRTPSQEPPSLPSDSEKDSRTTSSLLRPLGVSSRRSRSKERELPQSLEWQKERWKHWENLAKERGDEFHEQETLV